MPIIRRTRIDASGNVGIGTNLPNSKLQVIGNTKIDGDLTVNNLTVSGIETIINTNVNNTERLEIINDGTGPALRITQTGAQPIADFCDDASNNTVVRIADNGNVGIGSLAPNQKLDVSGNTYISGNMTANNLMMSRNKIINGDFRIDQRNNGLASNTFGTLYNNQGQSLDRWKVLNTYSGIGITHKQTPLTGQDIIDTGSTFTNAISLGVNTPIIHLPLDNFASDIMGYLSNPIMFGMSFATSPVKIGTHCANFTSNTINATPVSYLTYPSPQMTIPISMSCWVYFTAVTGANNQIILSFGNITLSNDISFQIYLNTSGQAITEAFLSGVLYTTAGSAATALLANTWYHLCSTITVGGSLVLYINGVPQAATSISTATVFSRNTTGFRLGAEATVGTVKPAKCYVDDVRVYSRALNGAEIAYLAAANYSTPFQLKYTVPASPTMSFPFEGNLTDDSGNGNTWTTVVGTPQYVTGHASPTALYLANEANVVTTQTKASNRITMTYNQTGSVTMSTWLLCTKLPTNSGNQNVIFGIGNVTAINVYLQYASATTATMYVYNGSSVSSGYTITTNTWYHVTMVIVPSGSSALYVNGNLIGLAGNTIAAYGSCTLAIGDQATTSNLPFAGYIDDFRLYNSALTAAQIANLYNSYTPIAYTLFQQPVDNVNIQDLGWGATSAQPITTSMWIKNNTPYPQQFTLSINNNSSLIGHFPLDNTYVDTVGTVFTQPVRYGTPTFSNSIFKVGSHSIFFPNTPGSAPAHYLSYTIPPNLQPQTVSLWFNPSSVTGQPFIVHFGSTGNTANNAWNLRLVNNTQIYVNMFIGNPTNFYQVTYDMTITTGTWYHVVITYQPGGYLMMYMNGAPVATNQTGSAYKTALPQSFNLLNLTQNDAINCFQIGGGGTLSNYAYNGYVDDVRIYNRPLTAAEVFQMYNNNAPTTTPSTYLLNTNECYLAQTPVIPANTWRKVSMTIPGDTTGYWNTDLLFSLCLGTTSTYASSTNTWLNQLEFTVTNNQYLNETSSNFTGLSGNSLLITGVQLEKGNMASTFDYRLQSIDRSLLSYPSNNIAFFAYYVGSNPTAYAGVMPYNNTYYNYGNGYNTTTYVFTAPVSGVYLFTASALLNAGYGLSLRGNQYSQSFAFFRNLGASQDHAVITTTIQLNAGNYIYVHSELGSVNGNNSFTGALLFATW